MDWIKQLNEVMSYIEENLVGEISHEEISRIARCSIYNFQRMFSYIADKSLSEYIRRPAGFLGIAAGGQWGNSGI